MRDEAYANRKQVELDVRASYNNIAEGYKDPSHETVRNFEALTLDFLIRHMHIIRPPLSESSPIAIDIGGGRGWVAVFMSEHGYHAVLGDISDKMLEYTRGEIGQRISYCHLSAFDLPFRKDSVRLVTTFLCGAYLHRQVIHQIYNSLVPRGVYIVTETPSEWTNATQPSRCMPHGKTWYKNRKGETVLLPFSFIYTLEELRTILTDCGFHVLVAETLKPGSILSEKQLSNVNRKAADVLGIPSREIPMLSAIIASK